jgi:FemAB-related protein (PEP-CTERM system-associated)
MSAQIERDKVGRDGTAVAWNRGLMMTAAPAAINAGVTTGAAIIVRPFAESESGRWDEFVLAHAHGSPFHLTAWKKSIEETFGYESRCLVAAEGARIRGVLPLFLVKNPVTGRALISSPFAVYGGILADSEETRDAMARELRRLAESLGVQYVDLRNSHSEQCSGFQRISRYVTFTQTLDPNEEEILASIPRKTRYMVRKALKQNFTTQQHRGDLSRFEQLYSRSLHRLGTPSFPPGHFQRLLANFGDMADIRETVLDGKTVAAVLSFYFRDRTLPYYGASDPAYNAAAPNNFMYFDQMRWGARNGYRIFDFGRSKKENSGSYDFKAHWGMEERDLPYEILLVKRRDLPNYSPNNARFRTFIRAWQALPYPVARIVGPHVLRLFP